MMRKQDNHHITYKEKKTMVSRMGRVIQGVKNDDGEVGQVKGSLGEGIFFNKTLISNEDEDNEKGNTIKSRAMGQL
jgi:hypothetical protein